MLCACANRLRWLNGVSKQHNSIVAHTLNQRELDENAQETVSQEAEMKKWGGYMFFFGIGSIILHFIGMQFIILVWIDFWGPLVGWIIRIGLAVGGAVLWLVGNARETPGP
jgi:hypothetical protein